MNTRSIWGLLLLLFLLGCKDETSSPAPPLPEELLTSIAATKLFFFEARDQNNLITTVDTTTIEGIDYWQVTLEDGTFVYLDMDSVRTIDLDPGGWAATLNFSDNTSQNTDLLGDSIYIDGSNIFVNPYNTAPLTALVKVNMPVKGKFGIKVLPQNEGDIALGAELESFEFFHELPILGLFPEHDNEVEIYFRSEAGELRASKTIIVSTGGVSTTLNVEILSNELPISDEGIFIVGDRKIGFDQNGVVRWYYTGDGKHLYRKTKNGNLLVSAQQGSASYHSASFYEISMLGQRVKTYLVPNKMHHEVIELPNRNFLVASNSSPFLGNRNDGNLEEDLIVEIDRESGAVIKSWNLNDHFNNDRPRLDGSTNDDWMHMNALYFDETDQSIVFSGRHQSVVSKLDYETGAVKWVLAHPSGWNEGLADYILQPIQADGTPVDLATVDFLPYWQHAPLRLPNGNVLLFDNGNYRNKYEDSSVEEASYNRAVEYKIDEENLTVELVWQYDYNKEIFTVATGDVDYFPENGHRIVGFMNGSGKTPKIVELDQNGDVVFEVNINQGANYYRCEKLNLYDGL